MLLDLDKTNIEMVRGDTFKLSLPLNSGTREYFTKYTLTPSDKLFIGIMKPDQSFEHAEVRCMIDHCSPMDSFGNPLLLLNSQDTAHLWPGKYYMTVKFVSNDEVHTLIDQKQFFITGSRPCC